MISVLKNPKTNLYFEVKNTVLSINFRWFWNSGSIYKIDHEKDNSKDNGNISFYSHILLDRPEKTESRVSLCTSEHTEPISRCIAEILRYNNVQLNAFLRINANAVHPFKKIINTTSHIDHQFDHKNIILYLTDAGGSTTVGKNIYNPKEDDVITFGGEYHHFQTPKDQRRVVIVATFI